MLCGGVWCARSGVHGGSATSSSTHIAPPAKPKPERYLRAEQRRVYIVERDDARSIHERE